MKVRQTFLLFFYLLNISKKYFFFFLVLYNGALGPNSGKPGIDYPTLDVIPKTSFTCKDQRYKGFFGDPETNCQVWHYCDLNGGQASFLCPNGTIFNQVINKFYE